MKYLENFNHQIYGYNTHPKLVFLHGLMGFGANWRRIISDFESEFQILTYDQRGHGKSFKPLTGYAPEHYAMDLLKIIDELGWEKIHLVGHSMGGRNALSFATQFPRRVTSLVIEDIGPESNPSDIQKYQNLLGRVPTPFPNKKTAKEFLLNDFGDPVLGNYFYANLVEKEDGLVDWRFSKSAILESVVMGRAQNRWKDIKALSVPTLLIRGDRSEELSHEVYAKMLSSNPHIHGVEISNAGHWVHFDQPAEFSRVLKTFLDQFL
jgi:pimeloyl-ACP methyl ester carboxylesterase